MELEGKITISKREYFHLRRALERYERLERAKIEQWNNFGNALNRNGNKLNIYDWEVQEQQRIENL